MTPLTSTGVTTNSTAYTTASISPTSKALILVGVAQSQGSSATTTVATPSLSGLGLTWTQVASKQLAGPTVTRPTRVTVFRALSASTVGSGALTINTTVAQSGCGWSIAEFANVASSGTNGSGAVVQSASTHSTSATTFTINLAGFASTRNAAYGLTCINTTSDITVGTGFAQIHEHSWLTPDKHFLSEWKLNDNTVDFSAAANKQWIGIALEIRSTVATGAPTARVPLSLTRLQAVSHSAVW